MNRLSFKEQIEAEAMKAYRARNASAYVYYTDMLAKPNLVACVSYETFSKSHAFKAWMEYKSRTIQNMKEEWEKLHLW